MNINDPIVMGLRLGKKDIILKRWLQLSTQSVGGQTAYLKLALLSYINNVPIKIGAINPYAEVSKNDLIKTLTFTKEDGVLYTWIENIKQEDKSSTKIKRILNSCIEITEDEEYITNYAILNSHFGNSYSNNNIERHFENEIVKPDEHANKPNKESNLRRNDSDDNSLKQVSKENNIIDKTQSKQARNIMQFVASNVRQG